jgi:hypothetical protein
MKSQKLTLIFVTIFLALAFCVSAQPHFAEPQIGQATEGLIIEYPQYKYIKQGQNFTLHTHVIDGLNGTIITNETTYCFLHLYDKFGRHILQENMSFSDNGVEFELYISEGNFTDLGLYAYIIQCNGTQGGGFDAGNFEVTDTGNPKINKGDSNSTVIFFMIFLIIGLFLLPLKIGNFTKNIVTDFIIKRMFWIIGTAMLLMTSGMVSTVSNTAGLGFESEVFTTMWVIGISLWLMLIWLVFGTLIQTMRLMQKQARDLRMGEQNEN